MSHTLVHCEIRAEAEETVEYESYNTKDSIRCVVQNGTKNI
jgi:hypothetical protein